MSSNSTHDELYQAGCGRVSPHLRLEPNRTIGLTPEARSEVEDGIRLLKLSLLERPSCVKNWATYWILGKAFEALTEFENAYQSFLHARALNPKHVDVLRELARSCIATGRKSEAVDVAEAAVALAPHDALLISNYGVALLHDDRLRDALSVVRYAHTLSPSDQKIAALLSSIEQQLADDDETS